MEKLEITQEEKNEITAALQKIFNIADKHNSTEFNQIVDEVIKINELLEIEIWF